MRLTRAEVFAAAAGIVTAGVLGSDLWPGLRGPENWRWARRVLATPAIPGAVTALFLVQAFVAGRLARAGPASAHGRWIALLGAAVGILFAQMVLLTALEPGGLGNVARRVRDPSFTSYHTIAADVRDPANFLRRYHRIQGGFPVHGPSQPPGRVLYFWAVERLAGARRGAGVAGFLLMAIGAAALLPLSVLVGGRCAPRAVGAATLLMGCLPGYLLFTPETDHLILFLATSAAACLAEAMRSASRRRAPLLAFAGGLAASAGMFVSFTELAALGAWGLGLAGMVLLARRRGAPLPPGRRIGALSAAGVAGFAIVPLVTSAIGMDWPAVFRECMAAAQRVQEIGFKRRYSTWVLFNLVDFGLFLGPPLALACFARAGAEARAFLGWAEARRRIAGGGEIPFALALLAAVAALDLSGRILGETGRIWMFLMPLGVGAAARAHEERTAPGLATLAVSQLLVLIALRMFVRVPG